mgnify:CR=1 FL=1
MARMVCSPDQLIRLSLIAGGKVDNPAVAEAVGKDAVLHDGVVSVGVDAQVRLAFRAPVHDGAEDAMALRGAADAVDLLFSRFARKFASFPASIPQGHKRNRRNKLWQWRSGLYLW